MKTKDKIASDANHTTPFICISGCIASTNPVIPALLGKSLKNTFNNTATEPTIVIGKIEINESLTATKCFSAEIFCATGTNFCSIQFMNPFILFSPYIFLFF